MPDLLGEVYRMRFLIAVFLSLLLAGAATAEPEPGARDGTAPLLQGDPTGETRPADPITRNELIELLDRSDRRLGEQQQELAPAGDLDELHRLIRETGDETVELEERVESLERDEERLEMRERNTTRPGF